MAVVVVALTAVNARTVILATGIYSEMVYSSLSIAGLWLAEVNEKKAKTIFRIINESNGRYLILTSSDFEYDEQAEIIRKNLKNLLEQYPKTFVSVFKSSDGRTAIYRIMKGTSNLI